MEKWSIEKMTKYWNLWEERYGESFIDYFVDDNTHDMGLVVGFFCGRFPELGKYILEASGYKIPWSYVQDEIYRKEFEEEIPSISYLVELFYNVEDEEGEWHEENYEKEIYAWCSLIHDIDAYYERFMNWVDEQDRELILNLVDESDNELENNVDYKIIKKNLSREQAINALDKGEWVRHYMMPEYMGVRKHDNESYDYENDQFVYIDEFWKYWGEERFKDGWMIIKFNC